MKLIVQWMVVASVVWMVPGSAAISLEQDGIGLRLVPITLTMPTLHRDKQVWVYLPPGYGADERRRFPVLYMLDGQHLFDSALIFSDDPYTSEWLLEKLRQGLDWYGSWRLERSLDRLFSERKMDGIIVVGISSGDANRTAEYSPWPWRGAPHPEADRYIEFIIKTLKPHIDGRYPTLSGRADTGIAGSSMGGLLALYAGLKYQGIFSKVAAFSPVLTPHLFGQLMRDHIHETGKADAMKIYVDLGGLEPNFGPIEPIHESLRAQGFLENELWFRQIPGGEHRIEHWRERFAEMLLWLYGSQ